MTESFDGYYKWLGISPEEQPPNHYRLLGIRMFESDPDVIDNSLGVVCVVRIQGGVEQKFIDGGYRLATWSFFNGNGAAQRDRIVTPLIFKPEGRAYRLTGIGKTRRNTGAGLQTFPFEPVAGSESVGAAYVFGFYTGDAADRTNAGVVSFDENSQDSMTILTLNGQHDNQKLLLGELYREEGRYLRTYSIHAVAVRKGGGPQMTETRESSPSRVKSTKTS